MVDSGLEAAHDFALSYATESEVKDDMEELSLKQEEVELIAVVWRRLRGTSMAELVQARLPGGSSPSASNTASGLTRLQTTRIRTFQPVLGKDGHRHGMASSNQPFPR